MTYNEAGLANSDKYWQLKKNQMEIGWDNLIRGKYSKHLKFIQHDFTKKNKDNRTLQGIQKECKKITEIPKKKKKTIETKRKPDIFQRLFDTITNIVHELWLERKTDRHNPAQGQLQMAKATEATRTVIQLCSLGNLVMTQYDLQYFALDLPQMMEQSYSQMLQWATRWKLGIYHSMK